MGFFTRSRMRVDPNSALFVDTATVVSGYALFGMLGNSMVLLNYGLVRARSRDDWRTRCLMMTEKLSALMRDFKPGHFVQEFPMFQAGERGMAAARGGATIEMAYLCGRVEACWEFYCAKVLADTRVMLKPGELVHPATWKGQLPKDVTNQRCETYFNLKVEGSADHNWSDAVMLGKWYLEERQRLLVQQTCEHAQRSDA